LAEILIDGCEFVIEPRSEEIDYLGFFSFGHFLGAFRWKSRSSSPVEAFL